MAEFVCSTLGCSNPGKTGLNGKCVSCACKEAKARHNGEPPEQPGTMPEEKENAMPETCQGCGREKTAAERFYKKKCFDCREKAKTMKIVDSIDAGEVKGEGDKGPEKLMGGGSAGTRKRKEKPSTQVGESGVIDRLLSGLDTHISEARKHYQALKAIKELSGAKIPLPDATIEL